MQGFALRRVLRGALARHAPLSCRAAWTQSPLETRLRRDAWCLHRGFDGVSFDESEGTWKCSDDGKSFDTSVGAARHWDELMHARDPGFESFNFPERYLMPAQRRLRTDTGSAPLNIDVEWIPPSASSSSSSSSHSLDLDFRPGQPLNLSELLRVLEFAEAQNIRVLDLTGRTDMCDYMIFASGTSAGHLRSIATELLSQLKERRIQSMQPSIEGERSSHWMVVDAVNAIVQLLSYRGREAYQLEDHWEGMRLGRDRYEGEELDALVERFPLPADFEDEVSEASRRP